MTSHLARRRPQQRCVFCGGAGLSKQHIWPKWLKKINQPHITSHTQVKANTTYAADGTTVHRREHQGHSGSRTARKVCQRCNNGWIERLEECIRPSVTRLMRDEQMMLDASALRDLAAWITLVTMMVEFTDLSTLATPAQDYVNLYRAGVPPENWKIWIVKYGGNNPGAHVVRHLGLQLSEFPDVRVETHICDTQVTTFVIGQFCAHSFCSSVLVGAERDYYSPINLPQIWPATEEPLDWSTARQLTDRGVISLAGAILQVIGPASL